MYIDVQVRGCRTSNRYSRLRYILRDHSTSNSEVFGDILVEVRVP
jgi:hypothetical protein